MSNWEKLKAMFPNTKFTNTPHNPDFLFSGSKLAYESLKKLKNMDNQYKIQKEKGYIDCADEYYDNLWIAPEDYKKYLKEHHV